MEETNEKPMSWGTIIGIMVATGLGVGLLLGSVGPMLGISPSSNTTAVGASIGVVGGLLITRRKILLGKQNDS